MEKQRSPLPFKPCHLLSSRFGCHRPPADCFQLLALLSLFVVVVDVVACCASQLYEIDDTPERKLFLDELFGFMQKQGELAAAAL